MKEYELIILMYVCEFKLDNISFYMYPRVKLRTGE
jgi:hypothetical protein